MRRCATTALSITLATSLLAWGTSPAIADTIDAPDCAPCHGDAHSPGEDNPHGYPTDISAEAEIDSEDETVTEDLDKGPDCSACHGDDHKQGDENPHGYPVSDESTESVTGVGKSATRQIGVESAENDSPNDTLTLDDADSTDELTLDTIDAAIKKEYTSRIASLKNEAESLMNELNTYEVYAANDDRVDALYKHIVEEINSLCIEMKEYAVHYVELILESDASASDKSDALDRMYDYAGDNASKAIYNDIYSKLIGDLYDGFLGNTLVLSNVPASASFEEWEYLYDDEWYRYRTIRDYVYFLGDRLEADVYSFKGAIDTALYNGDDERMQEKINQFKASIEVAKQIGEVFVGSTSDVSELRPEFKAAMDEYEAVYDDGCAFLVAYKAAPLNSELLAVCTDVLQRLIKAEIDFASWENKDLSVAEKTYYSEVSDRVSEKLAEASA